MYYNNKKLALSMFWAILGIVLVILSVTEVLDSSVYAGMGACLATVGTIQSIRNLKYRKDADYREKIDTEFSDERNRFIRMKSWAWAGTIAVIVEGAAGIVAMILGQRTVQLVLSYSVCLLVFSYWLSYVILSKKY